MISSLDIAWLAGLYEGEGSFGWAHGPRSDLLMTDRDVMERVSRLICGRRLWQKTLRPSDGRKPQYRIAIYGPTAVGLMMTLFSLMGRRRRGRILELIRAWKVLPGRRRGARNHNSKLTDQAVRAIRQLRSVDPIPYTRLAPLYGVSPKTIRMAALALSWQHVPRGQPSEEVNH